MNYELTPEENEAWFQKKILPHFADCSEATKKPTFVLLTGQSGAGKTSLSRYYAMKQDNNPIVFGADDLRALHPRAHEILQNDERNYPFLTKKDAGIWREKLVDFAIKNKRNILIESVLLSPNDWRMGTLLKVKEQGFKIDVAALGVHYFLSVMSMFKRYEDQKKALGYGFAPTLDAHNDCYYNMPGVCAKMILRNTADSLCVFNREQECFYDSTKNPHSPIVIMNSINAARDSALTQTKLYEIYAAWQNIFNMMDEREASIQDRKEAFFFFMTFFKGSGIYLDKSVATLEAAQKISTQTVAKLRQLDDNSNQRSN